MIQDGVKHPNIYTYILYITIIILLQAIPSWIVPHEKLWNYCENTHGEKTPHGTRQHTHTNAHLPEHAVSQPSLVRQGKLTFYRGGKRGDRKGGIMEWYKKKKGRTT